MKVEGMTERLPNQLLKETLKEAASGDIFVNEVMKNHTTLRIGGPVDIYAVPDDAPSIKGLFSALKAEDLSVIPLGGGSNVLVSDEGIGGAVINTSSLNSIRVIEEDSNFARLFAEAGTPLVRLVGFAGDKGYKGIEGLTGIPGSLGGAIYGNAGSFGCEIGEVVTSVTIMDGDGYTFSIKKEDLGFGYRSSFIPDGVILLSAELRFQRDYKEAVSKRMNEFHREKMNKQPINRFTAGCVFKNPPGTHAGMLIDQSGCKGMKRGDIEVSALHANFFINRGSGSARDFLALMEDVRERVMKFFGTALEPEIKIVGRYGNG